MVRHPQYLGEILALFLANFLFYPHWLYAVLGILGSVIFYWSTKEEEKSLIKQFGKDYIAYMQKVPRMNLILGIIRVLRSPKTR